MASTNEGVIPVSLYRDQAVVRDGNLITSRLPSDLHVFCKEIVEYLREAPRVATRPLDRAVGRASAAYTHVAQLSQGPRGVASADYTTVVKTGPNGEKIHSVGVYDKQ